VQDSGFTEEQKQYLEGFIAALVKKRSAELRRVSPSVGASEQISGIESGEPRLKDPAFIHIEAQNRWVQAGGKLVPEELAKRAKHPFDMWDEMLANAAVGRFPKGTDIFLHKFHGLFYVAPNQDASVPGSTVTSRAGSASNSIWQATGLRPTRCRHQSSPRSFRGTTRHCHLKNG